MRAAFVKVFLHLYFVLYGSSGSTMEPLQLGILKVVLGDIDNLIGQYDI